MIRQPVRRTKDDEERILPLINIVFLLLVFFMVAGRLTAPDPFRIELPQSVSDDQAGTQQTVVSLGRDGRLALDGLVMDEAGLKAALAQRLAAEEALRVRLMADGRVEAVRVVGVMELLRDAGIEQLAMLTIRESTK